MNDPENKIERVGEKTWIITLEEDPETGDLIMPLPKELLEDNGWEIGDSLLWSLDEATQTATLEKKRD